MIKFTKVLFLKILLCSLFILLTGVGLIKAQFENQGSPNLILLVSDDHGCIITTQSPNTGVFYVSGKKFDTHIFPESYVLLKNIPMVLFGSQISDNEIIPNTLSKDTPIILVENGAFMITCRSLKRLTDSRSLNSVLGLS